MACYIVTFTIANIEKRNQLKEHLRANYSGVCPIHENCWAILTEQKSAEVRDKLMQLIEPSDRLFIIKSGLEAAWNGTYGTKNADWLKENL